MKNQSLLRFSVLLAAALASLGLWASQSSRFRVDTRNGEFRITDLRCEVCSGEYGPSSSGHAYLPAHYRGRGAEFTFTVEASEDVVAFVYSDSLATTTERTHRLSLANRPAGFSFSVVGVDRDGRRTAPFRANFDVVNLCFVDALQDLRLDGSVCKYEGSATFDVRNLMSTFNVKLPCVEVKGEPKKTVDNTELGFFGSLHAEYEFSSDGTAKLSAGGGDKASKGERQRWGKAFGLGIDWSYGGLLTYAYDGRSLHLNGGGIEAEFGGSIESPDLYWPGTPLFVKGEVGASGKATISWDGQRYVAGDLLSGFGVLLGADIPKIEITAGAGTEKYKLAAGVKGNVAVHGEFDPIQGGTSVRVNAPIGVRAFVKAFWLEFAVPIYTGTLAIYPRGSARALDEIPVASTDVIGYRDFDRLPLRLGGRRANGVRAMSDVLFSDVPDRGPLCTAHGADGGIELLILSDDPNRASVDSATLQAARVVNGAISGAPAKIWDDGTADFHPSVSAGSNGCVFAAWTNLKRTFGEVDSLNFEAVASNAEIAVAFRQTTGGEWTHTNLTSDSAYDTTPSIAAAPDGSKALVVWSRNAEPLMNATPDSPDGLRFSVWDGAVWSAPAEVPSVPAGSILSGEAAFDGTRGVYVFSVNPDFDGGCLTNVQLYATTYDGASWSRPELLAGGGHAPYDIHVWFAGGSWSTVWNCGGAAYYRKSTDVAPVEIAAGGELTFGEVRDGSRIVGLTSTVAGASEGVREVSVAYLNPATDSWSGFVPVTSEGGTNSVSAGVLGSDGKLKLLCREHTADCRDDYAVIRHFDADVSARVEFVADSMSVAEPFYDVGSNVTLKVKLCNRGLLPSGDLQVSLDVGAETLGPTNVPGLNGGEMREASFPWRVTTFDAPTAFAATTDTGLRMEQTLFKPDLAVDAPQLVEGIGERYVRARIRNLGLAAVPNGTLVEFRLGERDGELIGSVEAGKIQYGVDGLYDASVKWPSSVRPTAARQLVTVVVDPEGGLDEPCRDNNVNAAFIRTPLDTDGDGLLDDHETMVGTDVRKPDTDGDGLNDYDEVIVHHTCPTATTYAVKFDLGAYGTVAAGSSLEQYVDGGQKAKLPEFVVDGEHVFVGWDAELPEAITASLTLTAQYVRAPRSLTASSSSDEFEGAAEYLGWVSDTSSNMVGLVSVKAGKAGKAGTAKATATITLLETGKKEKISGVLTVGSKKVSGKDALAGLEFTATGISGKFTSGDFAKHEVTAVLNQSKSKDKDVAKRFDDFKGKAFVLSLSSYGKGGDQPFARGYGTLSIVFSKKGKAKVSGFLPDGTKVSSSAQLLLTNDGSCLPVFYSKSGKSRFAFALWFKKSASLEPEPVTNLSAWKTSLVENEVKWFPQAAAAYETPKSLSLRKFEADESSVEDWTDPIVAFPSSVPFEVSSNLKKWNAGKAASLKLKDGEITGADDPAKPNLTGLKLSFTPKSGTFKGSFTAVSLSESGAKPKLVKGKATVNGVLVDKATGYGSAVIKKTGSMPVTVK